MLPDLISLEFCCEIQMMGSEFGIWQIWIQFNTWDVVEWEIYIMQPINQQQRCDAVMSVWHQISEDYLWHRIEPVMKN